jgi:F-type H+-transporting ATPase subunit b
MEHIAALFSNNLFNCLILVGILVYMWMRLTPSVFEARKARIESAIKEAAQARLEGQEFFKKQEARIASAEAEGKNILADAEKLAQKLKADIEVQTANDARALSERITQQIAGEYQKAIMDLRSRSATAAVKLSEASLSQAVSGEASARLLAEFVEQLDKGGVSK